jgi:hypothetical protein
VLTGSPAPAGTRDATGGDFEPPAGGSRGGSGRASNALWRILLLSILGLGLLPRLPLLYNAAALFNSDEAVNALTIRHLLGGEIRLHPWGVTYYGLTEGLLALPFVAIAGPTALAFKLGAVAAFLALLGAVFLLGREVYGRGAGLAAAALLALFSPQAVRWSSMAASGLALVVSWGTLTLLWHERLRRQPPRAPELFALGCFAGLGLYTYELFLPYLAALGCAWSLLGAAALARRARAATAAARPAGLLAACVLAAGFTLGWAPKLALLLRDAAHGSHEPGYRLATAAQVARNVRLLGLDLLALLGVNPGRDPSLLVFVGPVTALTAALGAVLLAFHAASWLAAARRVAAGAWREPSRVVAAEAVLVLLVPANLALFLLSTNPNDLQSNHYLLPLLSSLPVLAGGTLVRLARRSVPGAATAAALAALLLGLPAAQIHAWEARLGVLDPRLRPVGKHEPLFDVLSYLERQGIHGAYAEYWTCYKATFLAGERVVVAPLLTWDRYPAYGRQVDALPAEAYVFHSRFPAGSHGEAQLVAALRARGRSFTLHTTGAYRIYSAPAGRGPSRLLPPPARAAPLPELRAQLTLLPGGASVVGAGKELPVPLVLANRGGSSWSAAGLGEPFPPGLYRVEVAYRWLDATGSVALAQGDAGLLPYDLAPGDATPLAARAPAPAQAGSYRLVLFVAQPGAPGAVLAPGGMATRDVQVVERARPGAGPEPL